MSDYCHLQYNLSLQTLNTVLFMHKILNSTVGFNLTVLKTYRNNENFKLGHD